MRLQKEKENGKVGIVFSHFPKFGISISCLTNKRIATNRPHEFSERNNVFRPRRGRASDEVARGLYKMSPMGH